MNNNATFKDIENNMLYWLDSATGNSLHYKEFKDEFFLDSAVSSILYAEEWLFEMLRKKLITVRDYQIVHDTLASTIVRICRS